MLTENIIFNILIYREKGVTGIFLFREQGKCLRCRQYDDYHPYRNEMVRLLLHI